MFSVFSLCLGNSDILVSFGFTHKSNFLFLFIFQNLWVPFAFVIQFLVMYVMRKHEYEADKYAVDYDHG